MTKNGKNLAMALAVALGFLGAANTQASVFYGIQGGVTNAEADFTVSSGKITVTLYDFEKNPTSDAQLISGITFDISGTPSGASLTDSSGNLSTISKNAGSYSAGVATDPLTQWSAALTGDNLNLNVFSGG